MPVVLVLIPALLVIAYFATRRTQAEVSTDALGALGIVPASPDELDLVTLAAFTPETPDELDLSRMHATFTGSYGADAPLIGEADWSAPSPSLTETLRKIFTLPGTAAPYADSIAAAESRYGIPSSLLARVLFEESRFRPDIISGAKASSAGALGIAQFMPATAAELGVNPLDPHAAIEGAARYLKQQYDRFGDWAKALAAYNWGPARVASKGVAAAPSETRRYVAAILGDVDL